jgi:hypothetical protein
LTNVVVLKNFRPKPNVDHKSWPCSKLGKDNWSPTSILVPRVFKATNLNSNQRSWLLQCMLLCWGNISTLKWVLTQVGESIVK